MFGDAGHGAIMALFAFTMIIFEKKLQRSGAAGEVGKAIGVVYNQLLIYIRCLVQYFMADI